MRRETRLHISLVIGFVAFLFAGIDSLEQNFIILAVCNFLLAAANIISLYFLKDKTSTANIVLLILNASLAFIIAYSFYAVGKKALPAAWIIVGVVYLGFSFREYKKYKHDGLSSTQM